MRKTDAELRAIITALAEDPDVPPTPWRAEGSGRWTDVLGPDDEGCPRGYNPENPVVRDVCESVARFIAAAREAVPALLDEVADLRAEIARLRGTNANR